MSNSDWTRFQAVEMGSNVTRPITNDKKTKKPSSYLSNFITNAYEFWGETCKVKYELFLSLEI